MSSQPQHLGKKCESILVYFIPKPDFVKNHRQKSKLNDIHIHFACVISLGPALCCGWSHKETGIKEGQKLDWRNPQSPWWAGCVLSSGAKYRGCLTRGVSHDLACWYGQLQPPSDTEGICHCLNNFLSNYSCECHSVTPKTFLNFGSFSEPCSQ